MILKKRPGVIKRVCFINICKYIRIWHKGMIYKNSEYTTLILFYKERPDFLTSWRFSDCYRAKTIEKGRFFSSGETKKPSTGSEFIL